MTRPDLPAPSVASSRLSRVLGLACLLLAIALPALSLYWLSTTPAEALIKQAGLEPATIPAHFALWRRVVVVLLGVVPVAFSSYSLLCARQSFLAFDRGEYFSARAIRGLRGLASGVLLWMAAAFVVQPLMMLALTAGVGNEVSMKVDLSSNQLLWLLFAGIVWQISTAMSKAAALAEENAQFV